LRSNGIFRALFKEKASVPSVVGGVEVGEQDDHDVSGLHEIYKTLKNIGQ